MLPSSENLPDTVVHEVAMGDSMSLSILNDSKIGPFTGQALSSFVALPRMLLEIWEHVVIPWALS